MDTQIKSNSHEVSSATDFDEQPLLSETRTCHNYWCNYETNQSLSRCPKCGRPLLTAQTYRLLGLALVVLGGILAIAGASLLILVAPKVLGGIEVKLLIWGIFGFLLAVGLSIMMAGIWQAWFGKRSQSLVTIVIALLITIGLIAAIGRTLL